MNSVSEADTHPMPRIDDLIDRLRDARYISTRPDPRLLAGASCTSGLLPHGLYDALWLVPIYGDAIWAPRSTSYFPAYDGRAAQRNQGIR